MKRPWTKEHAHGTRARYVLGCRCEPCRAANRLYYHQRQQLAKAAAAELGAAVPGQACPGVNGQPCPVGARLRADSTGGCCGVCREKLVWNGLVPAARARQHLLELSALNVGRRAVSAASDLPTSILAAITSGSKRRIRASTERRILAVDVGALSDHALVHARATWKRIRELLRWGYTKGELAQLLGCKTPALQLRKTMVLARTALAVEKLHRELAAEREAEAALPAICAECGYSHAAEDRLRAIAPMVDAPAAVIREAWSCFYGDGGAGERRLYRDLEELRARRQQSAVREVA